LSITVLSNTWLPGSNPGDTSKTALDRVQKLPAEEIGEGGPLAVLALTREEI
jgi:hypothetical protein